MINLTNYLEQNKETPFEYGVFDCATFCRDIVSKSLNLKIPFPKEYDGSRRSIKALFKKYGVITYESFLHSYLLDTGWKQVKSVDGLCSNDISTIKQNNKVSLAVWGSDGKLYGASEIGYGNVISSEVIKTYRYKGRE